MFFNSPWSSPNLSEMREMSEATEIADNFLAKSVDNFLLTKIDDLRRPPLAMVSTVYDG